MFRSKSLLPFLVGLAILTGLFLRLYHINENQFLFYDEGMYLGYNRAFLNLVADNPAHDLHELTIILSFMFKTALTTPKALWFFILNLRVFIMGPEAWSYARIVSAFSGLATVVLLFFWARRYFNSSRVAWLSALLLLLLPSHVFYSRLGMQEALSTLLFFSSICLYTRDDRIRWRFLLSVSLLSCVYMTNYRMIIAPVFIVFIEFFNSFVQSRPMNWLKTVVYSAVFYAIVIIVGSLYGGANLHVTLAWMFHQAQDAGGKFSPVNFLSYPYYIFTLEGFFFALFFWGNLYFIKCRDYARLLPFGIVILQMSVFSFAAEKGARYLCVVLPFMAAAAAVAVNDSWQRLKKARGWVLAGVVFAAAGMVYLSTQIALARTDYESAVHFITDHDPQAVIISTQPLVESLYMADDKHIVACPNDLYSLVELYKKGARYLILDPQAYISWTADGRRFSPPLEDFLQITLKKVTPLQTFPHLDNILLDRLVLDHNEQIMDSINFLSAARSGEYGSIRVYDLGAVFEVLRRMH